MINIFVHKNIDIFSIELFKFRKKITSREIRRVVFWDRWSKFDTISHTEGVPPCMVIGK